MNGGFITRRRADRFDAAVERTLRTGRAHAEDSTAGEYADLLEVVSAVRHVPAPTARPEFVADLRSRLMAEAPEALATAVSLDVAETERLTLAPATGRRERRIAAMVGGLALATATGSMAVAAQGSLPGEPLYPVKRVIEDIRTNSHFGDQGRGTAMLDNAQGRLDELDRLSRASTTPDAEAITSTLDDFVTQASSASEMLLTDYRETGSTTSVSELRDFTRRGLDSLQVLASVVPESARTSLLKASTVLTEIDRDALLLCPACADAAPLLIAPDLDNTALAKTIDDVVRPVIAPSTPPIRRTTTDKDPGTTPSSSDPGPAADDTGSNDSGDDDNGSGPTPKVDLPKVNTSGSDDGPVKKITKGLTGNSKKGLGGLLNGVGDTVDGVLGGVVGGLGKTLGTDDGQD